MTADICKRKFLASVEHIVGLIFVGEGFPSIKLRYHIKTGMEI